MLFSILRVSSDKSKIFLTATDRLLVSTDDHTVLVMGKRFSYKKDNQVLLSYLEKDSDVITFPKEHFVSWKSRSNKRDLFLDVGHSAFLTDLIEQKRTEGDVFIMVNGVGTRTIHLDWSECLEGIEDKQAGDPQVYADWLGALEKRFFNDDGEWIYGLDKLQEKALEILVEFAKERDDLANKQCTIISQLSRTLGFYKGVVTDLVNTVIPTTPHSVWGMDDESGGRAAQKQATKHAMAKVAGLLLPSMPAKVQPITNTQDAGLSFQRKPNMDFDGDQLNAVLMTGSRILPTGMDGVVAKMLLNCSSGAMASDIHASLFTDRLAKRHLLSTIIEEMQKAK